MVVVTRLCECEMVVVIFISSHSRSSNGNVHVFRGTRLARSRVAPMTREADLLGGIRIDGGLLILGLEGNRLGTPDLAPVLEVRPRLAQLVLFQEHLKRILLRRRRFGRRLLGHLP